MQMNVNIYQYYSATFKSKFMIENESQHKALGHSVFKITLLPSSKLHFPAGDFNNLFYLSFMARKEPHDRIVHFSGVLRDETR